MQTKEKEQTIELNAYQIAAYWWVKRIKRISDEFNSGEMIFDLRKQRFGELFNFNKLKNKGYRDLYLFLTEKFEQVCQGRTAYSLRTQASNRGHLELNRWLSEFCGEKLPNIDLCDQRAVDTKMFISIREENIEVFVGDVDQSGIRKKLTTKYKPNAVICEVSVKNDKDDGAREPGER